MKFIFTYTILFTMYMSLVHFPVSSQEIPILNSKIGKEYDFSQERQNLWVACDTLMKGTLPKKKFKEEERDSLEEKCHKIQYSEACSNIWEINCGCSWYCGAQVTNVNASSSLKDHHKRVYDATKIADLNYETAWVEGVKGYGIGEFVTYEFPPLNPRITKIIIANGYIKNKRTWKNNSRVKQLKMYIDDKLYTILNLKDVYAEQSFEVSPIGYSNRKNISYTKDGKIVDDMDGNIVPSFRIKFEISEVYKGAKYDDTAITEIYFDGIDVH